MCVKTNCSSHLSSSSLLLAMSFMLTIPCCCFILPRGRTLGKPSLAGLDFGKSHMAIYSCFRRSQRRRRRQAVTSDLRRERKKLRVAKTSSEQRGLQTTTWPLLSRQPVRLVDMNKALNQDPLTCVCDYVRVERLATIVE